MLSKICPLLFKTVENPAVANKIKSIRYDFPGLEVLFCGLNLRCKSLRNIHTEMWHTFETIRIDYGGHLLTNIPVFVLFVPKFSGHITTAVVATQM